MQGPSSDPPVPEVIRPVAEAIRRALAVADRAMNRLYGWRYNPLYQSGAIALALMVVVSITGLYLLLFYRIGSPWESVAGLQEQAYAGRWIRGLHRYASDAAVAAIAVHAVRMVAQGRSWGSRALAWVSGVALLGIVYVLGWTGYVMVWDEQARVLAVEGARLLDALPIFSEPISRTFSGAEPMPGAFFFLNLFLHIALPIGLGLFLWVHLSRVARPVLWPPRRLTIGLVALLTGLAVAWPAPLGPRADLLRLPGEVPLDLFYAFWLPLVRGLPVGAAWALVVLVVLALAAVPRLTRPRGRTAPDASVVDERLCTGCVQCSLDCPWEAITMVERPDGGRSDLLARVDPARCTSCGICAGSCAPMGVGPPERTGRDQLARVRERFTDGVDRVDGRALEGEIVVVGCDRGGGGAIADHGDVPVHLVGCAGTVHTSGIEHLLKAGAAGVLVLACPPRDCRNREGPAWAAERLFEDREAELHRRVDKRRVRIAHAAAGDLRAARRVVAGFREAARALDRGPGLADVDELRPCDPAEPEKVVRS